jgi:hypothetical protein
VDLRDVEQLVAEASAVASREKVSGVIGWDEVRMVSTTVLACALGVPATSPESVRRCRDKHETRVALQAAGAGWRISDSRDDVTRKRLDRAVTRSLPNLKTAPSNRLIRRPFSILRESLMRMLLACMAAGLGLLSAGQLVTAPLAVASSAAPVSSSATTTPQDWPWG